MCNRNHKNKNQNKAKKLNRFRRYGNLPIILFVSRDVSHLNAIWAIAAYWRSEEVKTKLMQIVNHDK